MKPSYYVWPWGPLNIRKSCCLSLCYLIRSSWTSASLWARDSPSSSWSSGWQFSAGLQGYSNALMPSSFGNHALLLQQSLLHSLSLILLPIASLNDGEHLQHPLPLVLHLCWTACDLSCSVFSHCQNPGAEIPPSQESDYNMFLLQRSSSLRGWSNLTLGFWGKNQTQQHHIHGVMNFTQPAPNGIVKTR